MVSTAATIVLLLKVHPLEDTIIITKAVAEEAKKVVGLHILPVEGKGRSNLFLVQWYNYSLRFKWPRHPNRTT